LLQQSGRVRGKGRFKPLYNFILYLKGQIAGRLGFPFRVVCLMLQPPGQPANGRLSLLIITKRPKIV
jgi:hypothetical protein